MKHRMIRILTAVVLICALLVSWSPIRARAMAGGGVIGGASAVGLALSPGMVGLLLLAAFGVYYMVDNADAIGRSLEVVLEAEATNTELSLAAQAEYAAALTSWWESAKAGAIDLVSAPTWIQDVITGWAGGYLDGSSLVLGSDSSYSVFTGNYTYEHRYTNSLYPSLNYKFSYEVIPSVSPVYLQVFCKTNSHYCYFFSASDFKVSYMTASTVTVNGQKIFYIGKNHAGSNYIAGLTEACSVVSTIPTINDLKSSFADVLVNGLPTVPIAPDLITGGISDQFSSGVGMDVIGLPDIVIPGPDVLPVNPSEGQTTAQAVTDYLMAALIAGEITWEQYWQLIGVYNPAIGSSVPTVGTVDPVTGTITNTEISTGTVVTPSAITDYSIDLTSFFPFCLPFDIYAFFELLAADPETPHLEFDIELPFMQEPWHVVIDLSAWDSTALLARRLELLAFIIGLCVFTREKFLRS